MLNELSNTIKRSPAAALLVLLLFIIAFSSLGALQVKGLSQLLGLDVQEVLKSIFDENTADKRNYLRWLAIINQLTSFLFPAFFFAYLAYQKNWTRFLRLRPAPAISDLNLSVLFLLFLMPLAQYAFFLNKQLPLPEWAVSMEEEVSGLVSGLLVMDSPAELLMNLLTIAVIPAIAEEFLFRGVIQQKIAYFTRRPVLAIWLSAIIFSAIHGQFEGFLARMLLGAALGYLLYWTKNLWVPIFAHFVNNGLQVVGAYFYKDQLEELPPENTEPISIWVVLLCTIFVVGIGYFIKRQTGDGGRAASP